MRRDWFAHSWRWHMRWGRVRAALTKFYADSFEDIAFREHPLAKLECRTPGWNGTATL